MGTRRDPWTIVLAAGDGSRLSHLTRDRSGCVVPKQFCACDGGGSLLHRTLWRAEKVSGRERTVVVVAAEHRCWWTVELVELPSSNVVVQPCNRGTACGVLLPLLTVLRRDPGATVVVLPSDHVVADERPFLDAIARAVDHVEREPERLVLLGVRAQRPDPGLGWIVPDTSSRGRVRAVTRFVEKPDAGLAARLMRDGALWNSFVFVVRAAALVDLFQWSLPWLVRVFAHMLSPRVPASLQRERMPSLYQQLPTLDFSRDLLQTVAAELRVVTVPHCGWSDVGTPEAVARVGSSDGRRRSAGSVSGSRFPRPPLDLVDLLAAESVGSSSGATNLRHGS